MQTVTLASSRLSLCLSAWNISTPTRWICVKTGIDSFNKVCQHILLLVKFVQKWRIFYMKTCIYLWLLWLIILHDYPGYTVTSFSMLAMVNSVVKFPTDFVVTMFTWNVSVNSLSWLLCLSEHTRGHFLSYFRLSPCLKESLSTKHQNWLASIISTPLKNVLYHCYTGIAHNLKHITLRSSFTYIWYFIFMLTNFSVISSFHLKFTYT
jgi:hypothetical protein